MKAAVFIAPGQIEVQETAKPEIDVVQFGILNNVAHQSKQIVNDFLTAHVQDELVTARRLPATWRLDHPFGVGLIELAVN